MRDRRPGLFIIKSLPLVAVGLGLVLSGCGGDGAGPRESLLGAMILVEDARGNGPQGMTPLQDGLASSDPEIRVRAVRALGRLEDPTQIGLIDPLLSDAHPEVRAEAVNAMGQSVFSSDGDSVATLLQQRLDQEADPLVRGVLGRTLGRLRYADSGRTREAEEALVGLTVEGTGDAPIPSLLGAVMGLEWMARRNREAGLSEGAVGRLETLTAYGLPESGSGPENALRIRRVALMALTAGGRAGNGVLRAALADPDPDVRLIALAALGRGQSGSGGLDALATALQDPDPRVRIQAVGSYSAQAPSNQRCTKLLEVATDEHTQVAVAALDLLDEPCPDTTSHVQALVAFLEGSQASGFTSWHRGGHALLALAGVHPDAASEHLPSFVAHVNPFARAYGARAATRIGDQTALETLAEDADPNVRTAAIQGLFRLRDHDADGVLRDQLGEEDPQLLLTVSGLLEGTPDPGAAVAPLMEAFHRISAHQWETLRDPRMGILERLGEVAGIDVAGELEPYLSDYDPRVAERVAEILTGWTGQVRQTAPSPLPGLRVPSIQELDELARTRVILEMEGGGAIEIRLFPHLAPTNAARFARLAESGTLDGLTFHRVVSNFVLQGGSPNANEMAGHGAYTRDEIGLQSNWRGTVGTSTRGRDTGDGQLFINLVDNLRLDHNYTIFGEVAAGMDVVDRVVEGQVIVRARVVGG